MVYKDIKDTKAILASKVYKALRVHRDTKVYKALEFREHKAIRVYKVPLVHRVLSERRVQLALRAL